LPLPVLRLTELELKQTHMTQKPLLWVEVGARACGARKIRILVGLFLACYFCVDLFFKGGGNEDDKGDDEDDEDDDDRLS
jgi:hypothetical protein